MRMGRFPQRAAKEFARNLSWLLVFYALIAAILTLSTAAPLSGVLLFGLAFFHLALSGEEQEAP